jgi:hypothetical protein
MRTEKLKADRSYTELASALVDRIKLQDATLWNRWVEIEASKQGINDIWNDVLRHVRNNIEPLSSQQTPRLIMAMRAIAHHEATQRQ